MKRVNLLTVKDILAGLLAATLLVLFSQLGSFGWLYDISSFTFAGVRAGIYERVKDFESDISFFTDLTNLKTERDTLLVEKQSLLAENVELQKQLDALKAIEKQNQFDLEYNLLPVRVTGNSIELGELTINKGRKSGIVEGQVAIIDNYAVGEVIQVWDNAAQIRLITSINSNVPVISLAHQSKGLLTGSTEFELVVKDILTGEQVIENEIFITSGINNKYPYGLNVGQVEEINSIASEPTKEVMLTSGVDYYELLEIFIILGPK